MVDRVERAAATSVARGCGFAALGIVCVMIGFAHEPIALLRAGGILVTGLAAFLAFRAGVARSWPYKKTETWLMLEPAERPPPELAQRTIGTALEGAYGRFAGLTAKVALVLWGIVAALLVLG